MNLTVRVSYVLFLVFTLVQAFSQNTNLRERTCLDENWKFAFGHAYDADKDFGFGKSYFTYLAKAGFADGAAASNFDDRYWRVLNLPHDWAVELPFNEKASYSHGFKPIGKQFPESSVAWYRKNIQIPNSDFGKVISLQFDGVFRNAAVWFNGHFLGNNASGYLPVSYQISELINYGGENVISVRVDASTEEGWFYEGAGIYRHVWLQKTAPVHVANYGTFVSSQISKDYAIVKVKSTINNLSSQTVNVRLVEKIIDKNNTIIASNKSENVACGFFKSIDIESNIPVNNPILWNLENPYLYTLVTEVYANDTLKDSYKTKFGIRTAKFDSQKGFLLNGNRVQLKGTNNHQDHAGVGTAITDSLLMWRLKSLKAFGNNAYRCSHHPPSEELLDFCDQIGMLVIDENRLMQTSEKGLNDLTLMIKRDRNHPAIIAWSVGNEEWMIEGNEIGQRIVNTLQGVCKGLDSTRATTAGVSNGFKSGIAHNLEVMGYNYLGNGDIEYHYKNHPHMPGMGTEEGSTFTTRGVYESNDSLHYKAAYDQKPRPSFFTIQEGWKFYAQRPNLAGVFFWTGFDYRGEATPYSWPSVMSYFGLMDLCGFPKDNVHYLKSWWKPEETTLHILPHWNWKGKEGKLIDVWVYSNCEEVELFLNNKSLGTKIMETNGHLSWPVKYEAGTLKAIGYKNSKQVLQKTIATTSEPTQIVLHKNKAFLKNNLAETAVIEVSVADKNNLFVPTADNEISFTIEGPAKIIGVGNGDPTSLAKEKFIDSIFTLSINNLKEKSIDSSSVQTLQLKDASFKTAFEGRNFKNQAKAYAYFGDFILPENYEKLKISYFHKNICTTQSVWINGHLLINTIKNDQKVDGFLIPTNWLQKGQNQIVIQGLPLPQKYDWELPNKDPGLIQAILPAQQVKRKLFNGLAQVLIQPTTGKGVVKLTAVSKGLKVGVIELMNLY